MLPPFLLILSHLSWNMESKLFQPGWFWANDEPRPYPSGIFHVIYIMVILLGKFLFRNSFKNLSWRIIVKFTQMTHGSIGINLVFSCQEVRKWGCNQPPPHASSLRLLATNDSQLRFCPHKLGLYRWKSEDIVENILHEAPGWLGLVTPRKINMEPENTALEEKNHLPNHHFQVLC